MTANIFSHSVGYLFSFLFFFFNFIYFLVALCLHYCVRAFSSCGERGLLFVVNAQASHCGFSFVFSCGVSFFVSSSVFLSMTVQQLVVIPVFSKEGVSACSSTPPS